MTTLSLSRLTSANIRFKPLSAIFNVLLLAMGIAVILTMIHLNDQLDKRFSKDLQGIDLVVSGKGSPLQIILSSVFHIDIPTGNIPLDEAYKLKTNPLIKSAIPVALGDNYNGYRIVGTNRDYIAHYKGELALGSLFSDEMQVVLGSEVAAKYKNKVGDKIVGAHGLVKSDDLHADHPYTVVGILKPTGTILDRLVLTPVESVWHVHEEHHHHDHQAEREHHHKEAVHDHEGHEDHDAHEAGHHHDHEEVESHEGEREITALLISYKSPLAAAQLPRLINGSSSMQAASPASEVARLNKLLGTGGDILSAFGILLIGFSAFGLFITLYNAVNERKYDIALMRSLGATRGRIFQFIMTEVLALGLAGSVIGIVLTQIFLKATAIWIYTTKHIALDPAPIIGIPEACIILAALGISILAGLIPAVKAYRTNIVKILGQG
jgi:putative ABC transport system permease protein